MDVYIVLAEKMFI